MKIIDLLNKIAKGEEVPKKVSINGGIHGIDVWEYDENCKDYMNSSNILLLYSGMTSNHLTDEVEILEEVEDKEYEDIEVYDYVDNYEVMYPNTIANNFVHLNEDLQTITGAIKYILERLDK